MLRSFCEWRGSQLFKHAYQQALHLGDVMRSHMRERCMNEDAPWGFTTYLDALAQLTSLMT